MNMRQKVNQEVAFYDLSPSPSRLREAARKRPSHPQIQRKHKLKKTLFSTVAAILLRSAPAFAWQQKGPITICNHTDPETLVKVIFRDGTTLLSKFPLEVPAGQNRMFGPVPETGPCLQDLFIRVSNPVFGKKNFKAATKFNACQENFIDVSGVWDGGLGSSPIIISHWKG